MPEWCATQKLMHRIKDVVAQSPRERCTGPFKQGKAAPKFMPISTLL